MLVDNCLAQPGKRSGMEDSSVDTVTFSGARLADAARAAGP